MPEAGLQGKSKDVPKDSGLFPEGLQALLEFRIVSHNLHIGPEVFRKYFVVEILQEVIVSVAFVCQDKRFGGF